MSVPKPQIVRNVESALASGETILWLGSPKPLRSAIRSLWLVVTGSIFLLVPAALFYGFLTSGLLFNWFVCLPLAPMLITFILGLCMSLSPVYEYVIATRTIYVISQYRILIIRPGRKMLVDTYERSTIRKISRLDIGSGNGDLTFTQNNASDVKGESETKHIVLVGVKQVRAAERLLLESFGLDGQ